MIAVAASLAALREREPPAKMDLLADACTCNIAAAVLNAGAIIILGLCPCLIAL